ncbi:C40 family peptidase [Pontibacter sp. JH31]|uniref:C40 family peptidase n=1 Tax=Pontibacter aquaedesilientis TaxID=2766980 RepID=A0ABR7XC96_9BACT|nr:C40 family peptidase [Pontibacter aquaedesilientis]MBD1395932.1 C40 family peptidase [Pontibacter aquaedesilientis]
MKKIFLLVAAPLLLLFLLITLKPDHMAGSSTEPAPVHFAIHHQEPKTDGGNQTFSKAKRSSHTEDKAWYAAPKGLPSDELIDYAVSLIGTPYVYGGTSSNGFDCSGFTSHVFEEYGVPITRSSSTQSQDGVAVDREDARPGDLVIFTGTNLNVREPGHVGIVISEPGDTISFVHSSSNGGVKISQVEGTRYNDRLLGIRRVL